MNKGLSKYGICECWNVRTDPFLFLLFLFCFFVSSFLFPDPFLFPGTQGQVQAPYIRWASMKTFALLASLVVLWLAPYTVRAADTCSAVSRELPSVGSEELNGCVCDPRPMKLRKNLTSPFSIVAACNLRWNPGESINPGKRQSQLERKSHLCAYGCIFMSGEATLEGNLGVDEMGRWVLILDEPFMLGDVVYKVFGLGVGEPPEEILIYPKHLHGLSCLKGRAKVMVKGLFIMFTDMNQVEVSARASVYRKATLDRPCSD